MIRMIALAALLASTSAYAVPTTMSYAGTLKDAGQPVNDTVDVVFSLFDAPTGGTQLYTETQNALVVVDGLLAADIGQNGLDDSVLNTPSLFLEVDVDGVPLLPRVRLESVPYALRADKAAAADVADALGAIAPADVVTQTQLVTLHLDHGIAAGSGITITNGTIAIGTVTSTMIGAGQVGPTQLAADAVDSSKIKDLSIVDADINATANIQGSKIAAGTITNTQLGANAVGVGKIASGAVDTTAILDGTIKDADISSTAAIAGAKLANGAVTAAKLAAGSVDSTKLVGKTQIFQVSPVGCVEPHNSLMTTGTCTRSTAGCGSGQCRDCINGTCTTANCGITICINTSLGFITSQ